ncbi:hypothetical protein [Pseudoalteromonas mariniglutinosa]|uniref:hypothetical protein n=2 Tax=Pseudoalteromonas mariniglutinosa TaxID=206042 RepID=UPI00384AC06E
MQKMVIVILMTVLPVCAWANTSEAICKELKAVTKQLQQQTPMEVDYMTTLTGVQSIYVGDTCHLNYNYLVKSRILLKEMQEANSLSLEDNLAHLQTEEGRSSLQSSFDSIAQNSAKANFAEFRNVKGMQISYYYTFDDLELQAIKAWVLKN